MARAGWRPDDEVSVDDLLRETGAMPRSLGAYSPLTRPREDDTGVGYRERLEQRAKEAAAAQQRAGRRIRWVSALCGGLVVVGSLVIIAVTSESSPGRQAAVAPDSLAPATTTPRALTSSSAPAPVPTVIRQTSASPTTSAPKTTAGSTSPTQAPPPPPAPVASCTVRYAVTDQWPNGFTANVWVTNTGNQTLNPWTSTWNFTAGQRVTHSWNGDFSQSGSRVTMKAVSYNLSLAPGATVNIGFNGSFDRSNPTPVGFTLSGARCTTT
ncbi:Cellulose binding domain-containing protein [Amycolatopsis tolypomycina]|uniref:Cellulose binding domain-containing protein n=1 Tax=Amycolatopsis tolypomycina TaxID=208445 RepID=A0A1H4YAJ7_9PSEU|nr:cellulose-binding domain-containing protein [Amycolatopsis tolypomycina]SED14191.1 Cellulose binding domain-containing protein [Amycolatopsis tolypomycina]